MAFDFVVDTKLEVSDCALYVGVVIVVCAVSSSQTRLHIPIHQYMAIACVTHHMQLPGVGGGRGPCPFRRLHFSRYFSQISGGYIVQGG